MENYNCLGCGIYVPTFQQDSESQIGIDEDSNETFYSAHSNISNDNVEPSTSHSNMEIIEPSVVHKLIPEKNIIDDNYQDPGPSTSYGNMEISDNRDYNEFEPSVIPEQIPEKNIIGDNYKDPGPSTSYDNMEISDNSDYDEIEPSVIPEEIPEEIPEKDFIENTLLQKGKGQASINFKLQEIAFKRYRKLPLYCKHYKLFITRPTKKHEKFDQTLLSEIYSQFFLVFHDAITKLKNEYPDRGFWIKLILPGNSGFIDKGLILPEDKTEDVVKFYKESLQRIMTSNNSLKLDRNFEVFFHILVPFM